MDIQTISIIVGVFIGLGTMIAGCGFAYAQYKTGGDKAKDNLIETLRATAEAEKAERVRLAEEKTQLVNSHQGQITQLTKDLSELKGRFDEQTKRANEYKEILQGRSPEQTEFMEFMTQVANDSAKYMKESSNILKEIQKEIKSIKYGKKA